MYNLCQYYRISHITPAVKLCTLFPNVFQLVLFFPAKFEIHCIAFAVFLRNVQYIISLLLYVMFDNYFKSKHAKSSIRLVSTIYILINTTWFC